MEKPRKKQWYYPELSKPNETEKRYIQGKIDSWNDCHAAMSAWIEGAVPTVEEIAMSIEIEAYKETWVIPKSECYRLAKAVHSLLTQRLGVVK